MTEKYTIQARTWIFGTVHDHFAVGTGAKFCFIHFKYFYLKYIVHAHRINNKDYLHVNIIFYAL